MKIGKNLIDFYITLKYYLFPINQFGESNLQEELVWNRNRNAVSMQTVRKIFLKFKKNLRFLIEEKPITIIIRTNPLHLNDAVLPGNLR